MRPAILIFVTLCVPAAVAAPTVVDTIPIDTAWAGHPVGFCLLTHGDRQFVAYYNADRQMVVAGRTLDSREWTKTALPEQLGWDSHNSIAMALDRDGYVHLSGNMHGARLVYFRSTSPLDITTLARIDSMVGAEEDRVTYPDFFEGPGDMLIFTYRDGKSGSGNQIYNVYDLATKSWRRLLDTPLTDGRGVMNAYFNGPRLGPDGFYHLAWVWRDTPDCATNHHVSYARSCDLVHWERGDGQALTLPMTIDNADIVDPVPPGGGAINGNVAIGFDDRQRVVIGYHKYDDHGHTQIYNARFENGVWKVYQASDWDTRWEFSGGGAIPFDVRVSAIAYDPALGLVQAFSNKNEGSGRWVLDPDTLTPRETLPAARPYSEEIYRVESTFPGMQVHVKGGATSGSAARGKGETAGPPPRQYAIRWETLGPNRDKPRDPPYPEPSLLTLIVVQDR